MNGSLSTVLIGCTCSLENRIEGLALPESYNDCIAPPLFLTNQNFPLLSFGPLGPLGFNFFQHMPTTRPSVERTAEKAFLPSDRVSLFSEGHPLGYNKIL
jgi:hypothetical protein